MLSKTHTIICSLNGRILTLAAIGAAGLALLSASPAHADSKEMQSPNDCVAYDSNGNKIYVSEYGYVRASNGMLMECRHGRWVAVVVRHAPTQGIRPAGSTPPQAAPEGGGPPPARGTTSSSSPPPAGTHA
jgi:hypothetical protein